MGSRCGCSSSVCCCCCCWYCCIVYSAQTKTKMQSALQWELGVGSGSRAWIHSACAAAVTVAESSQNIHGCGLDALQASLCLRLCALLLLVPSPLDHLPLALAPPPTLAPPSSPASALQSAQPPFCFYYSCTLFLFCSYSSCSSSSPTSSASSRLLLLRLFLLQFLRFFQLLHFLFLLYLLHLIFPPLPPLSPSSSSFHLFLHFLPLFHLFPPFFCCTGN